MQLLRALFLFGVSFVVGGCRSPAAIGGPCETGIPPADDQTTTITGPALECEGRACIQAGTAPAACSARCETDDDCGNVEAPGLTACPRGFVCAAAAGVGTHACERFCVCRNRSGPAPVCPAP